MLLGQIADPVKFCNKPVHGEDAVCCDKARPVVLRLFQYRFQFIHIVVGIAETFCFAEPDSVNDGSVIQLI